MENTKECRNCGEQDKPDITGFCTKCKDDIEINAQDNPIKYA